MQIKQVHSRKELKIFQQLPWKIYRHESLWVPPLLSQERELLWPGKHPFHDHALTALFLAFDGAEPVGRIGACLNEQHNVYHGERVGFWGFFECIDDRHVAQELLRAAKTWLKKQGLDSMRGPFNWSTNETCGLLVDGFDSPPRIMMPYNPPYYGALMEAAGLARAKNLVTFELLASSPVPPRMERIANRARKRSGITIRAIDKKGLKKEVHVIKEIYNAAWSKNWGFVPMTSREVDFMAHELESIIDPRLLLFAEVDGDPAGFCMTLPDVNEVLKHLNGRLFPLGFLKALWWSRRISFTRLLTLGIKEQYRRKGIEVILIIETLLRGREAGYVGGELGWVLEDNHLMIRDIEAMGARQNKTYRIYESTTA